jgi:cobalt-zinc-cadmium efflux system membrane fusion protein
MSTPRKHIPRALAPALALLLALAIAGCGGRAPRAGDEAAHAGATGHGDGAAGEAHGDEHAAGAHVEAEDRVTLAPGVAREAGIEAAPAGPRDIEVTVVAPGEVRLDAERVVQVRPRFAGMVQALPHRLGDRVRAGDLMAVIHSNESLSDYEVRAPFAGTVVARDVALGQSVDATSVLATVADLGQVWVDFALHPRHAGRVRAGLAARVRASADTSLSARGTVSYVGPLLEQDTRVSHGRVVLDNRDGRWAPGTFVEVAVTVERVRAAVAVPEPAIVRTAAGPAVFVADGEAFALRAVGTGRGDGAWTEIVTGLVAGERVVVRNAFLLKAELSKGEASHDH